MKTKLIRTVFLALIIAVAPGWSAEGASASSPCNSAFVTKAGNVFTVKPNGTDDTANIQCAFDAAVASGAGNDVRLRSGTFHTGQIVVNDFHGNFTGAGVKRTVVTNLPNLYVTPVDVINNPPSADNPWPTLFAFVDGDFAITDLAISIVGNDLTTGWTIFGISPPFEELAHAIMIAGTHANARIEHFLLQGEAMQGSLTGYNVINGIYYEGSIGEVPPPITGSYSITNSTIRAIGFATPLSNLSGATVVISRNKYENTLIATDAADVQNSNVEFSNNRVSKSFMGFDLWNFWASEDVGSKFLIRNNVLSSEIGIAFEQTFGAANGCLLLENNVEKTTDTGIFLGEGTIGCSVVGGESKTTVIDLGISNILVDVIRMEAGIVPATKTSVQMKRHP